MDHALLRADVRVSRRSCCIPATCSRPRASRPLEVSPYPRLWLVALEFTAVRFGGWFNFDYSFLGLAQVIWILGVSMIVLAALVPPLPSVAAIGLAVIVFHNALDEIRVAGWQGPGTPAPDAVAKL